ncbi:WD40 protein DMR-N9 [Klebsormidium nitens]|uniref:WD40 protein DMR-N9 n=1 Tax=Klebsormidium nitens TaxID=105231 RepID=A0A1Y1HJ26_KLENI|nr:WD40 protein DMR-N9 [Klebsormidium nitens]|eukprot:GAQ78505.1 WD40 protein DMR-N9 [Klebsormidium nitens]
MASNQQQGTQAGVRTHFKTPEGRFKVGREKSHPSGVMHHSHNRTPTKITYVILKEQPRTPAGTPNPSKSSTVSRFLGSNGTKQSNGRFGHSRTSSSGGEKTPRRGAPEILDVALPDEGGEKTYVVYNIADGVFVADYKSLEKEPVKGIFFNNAPPLCHAFREGGTGHDLLIGLASGDVYACSLRAQVADSGRKLTGSSHFNKEGAVSSTRCYGVAWVPGRDDHFVSAHADGNIFLYDKNKEGSSDVTFPPIRDTAAFSVAHARSSKSNPIARWHISGSAINDVAFSPDGNYLATVGRDGCLRIFDWQREALLCGCKSYYGSLLCCAWSGDSKYVLTGGEDDLVSLFSLEQQAVVAWGEGHTSYVSGVAFDSHWSQPPSEEGHEAVTYRFGSVGQDTQLLLWDFAMEEFASVPRGIATTPLANSQTLSHPPTPTAPIHTANKPPNLAALNTGFQPDVNKHPTPRSEGPATPLGGYTPQGNTPHGANAQLGASTPLGVNTPHGVTSPYGVNSSHGVNGHGLAPPVSRKEVPKLAPIMAHKVHAEPLSDIVFVGDALLTSCHEGVVKIWQRPSGAADSEAGAAPGGAATPSSTDSTPVAPVRLRESEESTMSFG